MAKFRLVHTSFWNDPRVVEEMTAEDDGAQIVELNVRKLYSEQPRAEATIEWQGK